MMIGTKWVINNNNNKKGTYLPVVSNGVLNVGFVLVGELGSHHRQSGVVFWISAFYIWIQFGSLVNASNE